MGLFLFFTTLFGIAALLSSVLAYNFGFYSLGDWSIWMGWGGLTFFIFAVIGIGFKKALENIVFVVFKKFSNVVKHSGTVNEEKVHAAFGKYNKQENGDDKRNFHYSCHCFLFCLYCKIYEAILRSASVY